MKFSSNFNQVWRRDYLSMIGQEPKLTAYHGGYILAGSLVPCPVVAVSTNGSILWQHSISSGGNVGTSGNDSLGAVVVCGDGGVLLGFSSYGTTGGDRSAPSYGLDDIWLVKLDNSGNKVWDRSFGGAGQESLGFDSASPVRCKLGNTRQTEDGGFLIAGWTLGSQVSGNKTVDGDGVWLLKLDSGGFKESESVIESYGFDDQTALLPAPEGYHVAVASWIVDLTVRRVIDLTATATGEAFRLDYSYDLLNWTNIVSRYNGSISLEEDMEAGRKFYRCAEVP